MSRETTATMVADTPQYRLRSDLAAYCLPDANRDDSRKLAWANSICLLFLVVAFMGLRQPVFILRDAPPPPVAMPVVILPPAQAEVVPSAESEEPDLEDPADDLVDVPVVAPVMVAAPEDVSFSVPVEGYVALAPDARFVPPPPAIIPKAPPETPAVQFQTIRFGGKEFRRQPPPNYPEEFQRNRIGGTVEALITVGTNGVPSKVEVGRSSGAPSLDRHVCDFIRREWRARPGEVANYRIAITFVP